MGTIQFGFHLTLDLYNCPLKKLNDMENCYGFLKGIVEVLKMQPLIPPYIIAADSNEERGGIDPGGYTGFIVIAESHVSMHSFAKRGFVSIDIYSCKAFDINKAKEFTKKHFQPKQIEENYLSRGTNYPDKNIY